MGGYLLVSRSPHDTRAAALSADLCGRAVSEGMTITDLSPCVWLGVYGPHPPPRLAVGSWTLIGDAFDRERVTLPPTIAGDLYDYERKLLSRFWGRFVGVRTGSTGELSMLLRDPSGALECVVWSHRDLTVATSSPPAWLIEALRPEWRINYPRLAKVLRNPLLSAGPLPLDGPVSISPGTVQPLPLSLPATMIWTPSVFVRRGLDERLTAHEAADRLRSAIDESVKGLAGTSSALAAEVSGGLDSSLVAASLVHQELGPIVLWLNAYGETKQSDERVYVQALSQALGISPQSVALSTGLVTMAGLETISGDVRPGLNGLDIQQDLDWGERLLRAGATAVMTGKGGDSVLVQGATPDIFTDLWLSGKRRALSTKDTVQLAALNECSIWTMILEARRHERQGTALPLRDDGLLSPSVDASWMHPWLEHCDSFGPAKRLQIAGVIDNISRHAPSLQNQVVDVLHPLCAQPVVEACLSIPAPMMTFGGRDRGLARHAFSDRLPPLILDRRSKGDLTSLYGRRMLESLDVLRPLLLDGHLASNGIIDRAAAEALLTRDSLMWRGRYGEIMMAAAFEGWARTWERRLSPPN